MDTLTLRATLTSLLIVIAFALPVANPPDATGARASIHADPAHSVADQGPTGFTLNYERTIGSTEVPYHRSAARLNFPWGVFGVNEHIFIADGHGRRVVQLTSDMRFVGEYGTAGLAQAFDPPMRWLSDVAVVGSGQPNALWVADGLGHRVFQVDQRLRIKQVIGAERRPGTAAGEFDMPTPKGELLIADTANHRVQIYDVADPSAPRYVATLGVPGEPGDDDQHLDRPMGATGDHTFVYVSDSRNCRVQIFRRSTLEHWATLGTGCGHRLENRDPLIDEYDLPADLALDASGRLYVVDAGNHRIKIYQPLRWDELPRTLGFHEQPYATDESHFNHPSGVAIDTDGNTYIAESHGHRLIKLDPDGQPEWTFGTAGLPQIGLDGLAGLYGPSDVAIDTTGRVLVVDRGNDRVLVFDAAGQPLGTLDGSAQSDDALDQPSGLGVASDGRIFVADTANQRVLIFGPDDGRVGQIGVTGAEGDDEHHLRDPLDVAVDASGRVFVADAGNHRVQVCDASWAWQRTIGRTGQPGRSFDQLDTPRSLALDGDGRLYVADGGNDRVQVYSADGDYLTTIGGLAGAQSGQLRGPSGLAVDSLGQSVFVADWDNHRIQVYGPNTSDWAQDNPNGFGNPNDSGRTHMVQFDGQLFAAVSNLRDGAGIFVRDAGPGWTRLPGFGDAEIVLVNDIVAFEGGMMAAVLRRPSGQVAGTGEVWRSADGRTWLPALTDFSGRSAREVTALGTLDGAVYAAVMNADERPRAEIWRSASGSGGDWRRVIHDGFGMNVIRIGATAAGAAHWPHAL